MTKALGLVREFWTQQNGFKLKTRDEIDSKSSILEPPEIQHQRKLKACLRRPTSGLTDAEIGRRKQKNIAKAPETRIKFPDAQSSTHFYGRALFETPVAVAARNAGPNYR
ncbi:hypothetical protein CHS0354_022487 [Potamilus streckersoni]|uniref:Uncharacterized protein n=1 Tax=Potamilus streckersoni TaxID=2493646 RepID=A0AAE0SXJ1_9BIVA|nr:hypothetical protein CHS0354_022487 [Potamilus streckersoni]